MLVSCYDTRFTVIPRFSPVIPSFTDSWTEPETPCTLAEDFYRRTSLLQLRIFGSLMIQQVHPTLPYPHTVLANDPTPVLVHEVLEVESAVSDKPKIGHVQRGPRKISRREVSIELRCPAERERKVLDSMKILSQTVNAVPYHRIDGISQHHSSFFVHFVTHKDSQKSYRYKVSLSKVSGFRVVIT